jgi:hypothetical protein
VARNKGRRNSVNGVDCSQQISKFWTPQMISNLHECYDMRVRYHTCSFLGCLMTLFNCTVCTMADRLSNVSEKKLPRLTGCLVTVT